jgi:hypothetical protein
VKEGGGRLACVAMLVLVSKCCALQVAHRKLLEVSVHTMIRWQLEHLHDQDSRVDIDISKCLEVVHVHSIIIRRYHILLCRGNVSSKLPKQSAGALSLNLHLLLLLRHQIPQRQIVHHILHILDPVLQPIAATPQAIVLQVENLEASVQILDELIDEQRALVVAESDSVTCKTCL